MGPLNDFNWNAVRGLGLPQDKRWAFRERVQGFATQTSQLQGGKSSYSAQWLRGTYMT